MDDQNPDNPLDDLKHFLDNVQEQYGDTVDIHSDLGDMRTESDGDNRESSWEFEFDYQPHEIKDHLDRYVIGQTQAKKQLANAVCYHYGDTRKDGTFTQKKNILMIGNTGVGKTHLVEVLSDLIDVPFVKADATKFSGTGYVGKNVDSLVRELVEQSNHDINRAEHGIVFIDEIDKICSSDETDRDVSGRDVQTNLLKLLEETEVSLFDPSNPSSMIMGMKDVFQSRDGPDKDTINTRHILFICSGAFPGLEDHIADRLNRGGIGFGNDVESGRDVELLKHCDVDDLIDFGLEAEFVGRLPIRTYLHDLDEQDLYDILVHSKSSVLKQYKHDLSSYGIELEFTEDALREIARHALNHDIGARGLMTTLENTLFEYMHELPGRSISSITIDRDAIADPRRHLYQLIVREELNEFFKQEYGDYDTRIEISDDFQSKLIDVAVEEHTPPLDLLREKLSPLHHILKMVEQPILELDGSFVKDTDEAVDELFSRHYDETQDTESIGSS